MKRFRTLSAVCMALLLATVLMAPFASAGDTASKPKVLINCEEVCAGDAECIKACRKEQARRAAEADRKDGTQEGTPAKK